MCVYVCVCVCVCMYVCVCVLSHHNNKHESSVPQLRHPQVHGSLLAQWSLLTVMLAFSGLLSLLLRDMGPLSIVATIALLGLSAADSAVDKASQQWLSLIHI